MLHFDLSEQMVSIIGNALAAQRYDVVAPVIAELSKQVAAQRAAEKPAE
jgi:hypothetical protein